MEKLLLLSTGTPKGYPKGCLVFLMASFGHTLSWPLASHAQGTLWRLAETHRVVQCKTVRVKRSEQLCNAT